MAHICPRVSRNYYRIIANKKGTVNDPHVKRTILLNKLLEHIKQLDGKLFETELKNI